MSVLRGLVLAFVAAALVAADGEEVPAEAAVERLLAGCARLPDLPAGEAFAAADRLDPLARRVLLSPERPPRLPDVGAAVHRVAAGETPAAILRRYAMSRELLALLNPDYDERRLGAGQQLKVLDLRAAPLRLVVDKGAYRCLALRLLGDGRPPLLVAAFPVGIGSADTPTPVGATRVAIRVRDPEWTHPETRERIPPRDPRNILGGYWIGLDPGPDGMFKSIGFHGYTGEPSERWIEQPGSRGCLRLLQDDIALLYALVGSGTRVLIQD